MTKHTGGRNPTPEGSNYLPLLSLSFFGAEQSTGAGTHSPLRLHCLSNRSSIQDASPGGHSVQLSPHFLSLHPPPADFELAPEDEASLDDEDDADDELLDAPSSPPLSPLLDDRSFDGSSYSTGFMRGPHATAKN